jgi:glycine cleavage system aminomethyltransferase T
MARVAERQALFPNVRRSPYFEQSREAGARLYMVYNHMYMPIAYDNDPRDEYEALTRRVTLWDVGAERQTQLCGPDAVRLADYLCTRDLSTLEVGRCRYTTVCDPNGSVMTEPIVLMPAPDTVWISHGDVDLTLWATGIALAGGFDVEVTEPDVAPLQLQGPLSHEVMAALCPEAALLGYYRCAAAEVATVACVVSQTGWSGERGYEIFPLQSSEAPALWTAVLEAGESHGLLVTGPNLSRALEHDITDTHYFVNCGMDPFEAGRGRLVDLEHGPFIGQQALVEASARGRRRRTVGLLGEGTSLPVLEQYWPVSVEGSEIGCVLWAAYSYALERPAAIALVDANITAGAQMTVATPEGDMSTVVAELPLVS